MKKKDFEKIKSQPVAELNKGVSEKREKVFNLQKDLYSGKLKNVREIREIRRDIARMLTLVNNKASDKKS